MNKGLGWASLKLVVFTAFTVFITLWLASIIGNFRFFDSPYQIRAEFTDVTGLLNGDVVKAAGVTIGRVDGIEIRNGMAVVTMSIDEDAQIPDNVEAEVRFRNLIGQRLVMLVQPEDETTSGFLEDRDLITIDHTEPAFDLSDLFNGLRPLIRSTNPEDINIVAREVTAALRGRNDNLANLLSNISEISETVASKDQELSTLLEGLNVVTSDLAGRDAQLKRTLDFMNRFFRKVIDNKRALANALVSLEDAAVRIEQLVSTNDERINVSLRSLAQILDVVERKRDALSDVVRALPELIVRVERVNGYGEWGNVHAIDICKDDFGSCGARGTP
jgi:phospholipid/cholesterol/gamma-HCH transport system substrate-binding protein